MLVIEIQPLKSWYTETNARVTFVTFVAEILFYRANVSLQSVKHVYI